MELSRGNTQKPRAISQERVSRNESFVRQVLALIQANAEHRGEHGVYGEVVVSFQYTDGKITLAKMREETIMKPSGCEGEEIFEDDVHGSRKLSGRGAGR